MIFFFPSYFPFAKNEKNTKKIFENSEKKSITLI